VAAGSLVKARLAITAAVTAAALAMIPARAATAGAGWTLTATDPSNGYVPTFLGNGYLGLRVPAAGSGYDAAPVTTDAQLEGFYAQDPGFAQKRADIPVWSGLALSDGSGTYGNVPPATARWQGSVQRYRQTLDLGRGELTTDATWVSPAGRVTDLTYRVVLDEARPHVGLVTLSFTPHWTGGVDVTDVLDGRDTDIVQGDNASDAAGSLLPQTVNGTEAQLSVGTGSGFDPANRQVFESTTATVTGIVAGLASELVVPAGAGVTPLNLAAPESVAQQSIFAVRKGTTYTVTKVVGVSSSLDDRDPVAAARADAAAAASAGSSALIREHERAWADLWRSDIAVTGDPSLQLEVRASLFYLLASIRAGSDWSISPGGLSGPGYNGHIFWDAETWMYPSLLAMHPELAAGVNRYRYERLPVARRFATETGFAGARFPWESALSGDDQSENGAPFWGDGSDPLAYVPPQLPSIDPTDTSQFEQHVVADIALAQWQYYLATGDRHWLATQGWDVLAGIADFWAGHAVPDPRGGYDLDHVMGPDEYHGDVDNSAYVNAAAATALRDATEAARITGHAADPHWASIADGLLRTIPYDSARGIHPEFDGYVGDQVKQADVVMLQYPWALPMPAAVARNDLDYYMAHTDLNGPSMTDAIHAIDAAELGVPGCTDDFFLKRSIDPFMRGPFDQFSETRIGGEFTFITAVGGFLQEFLYGFTGLRFGEDGIDVAPTLPPQIPGVSLQGLQWQGRRFSIDVGPRTTTLVLTSGPAMPVSAPGLRTVVQPGGTLSLTTRRPDLDPTADLARCRPVTASSTDPSFPALGAVDGDGATAWQATTPQAWLQVDLGRPTPIGQVDVTWGASRGAAYTVEASNDGRRWVPVSARTEGRYMRVLITRTTGGRPPQIEELSVRAAAPHSRA
jgi:trehalose/maltose hydrolase-like predicted phosphorylase